MINLKVLAALIIHYLLFFALLGAGYPKCVDIIAGGCVVLNIFGLTLMVGGHVLTGGVMFIIGSVAFLPIGILGIIGARELMDEARRDRKHPTQLKQETSLQAEARTNTKAGAGAIAETEAGAGAETGTETGTETETALENRRRMNPGSRAAAETRARVMARAEARDKADAEYAARKRNYTSRSID